MSFAADLADMFDEGEFAEAASFQAAAGGSAVAVSVQRSTPVEGSASVGGRAVIATRPVIWLQVAEVAAVVADDAVTVGGVTYTVRGAAKSADGRLWRLECRA